MQIPLQVTSAIAGVRNTAITYLKLGEIGRAFDSLERENS